MHEFPGPELLSNLNLLRIKISSEQLGYLWFLVLPVPSESEETLNETSAYINIYIST